MKPVNFRILANQRDITTLIADRLESLTLRDAAGVESDTVTLVLDNRDGAVVVPPTGAELDVAIGLGDTLIPKGTYQVTEIEEPLAEAVLTIHATAAAFKGSIKAPKDRTFDNMTLGDLVQHIADEHALEPVIGATLAAVAFDHIDQKAESDLNLLNRLAREHDAIAKPVAGRLLVTPRGTGKSASGADMPEIPITDPADSAGTVSITERSDYQAVIAHWFDEPAQQKRAETAGSGSPVLTLRRTFPDADGARAAAAAELARLQRGQKTLSLTRPLTPELTAEARVRVANHKASANGLWIADTVTHTIAPGSVATTSTELVLPKA